MLHKNHVYFQHVLLQFNAQFYSYVTDLVVLVHWFSAPFWWIFSMYVLLPHIFEILSQSAYNFSQFCRIIIPLQCSTAIRSQHFWIHVNDTWVVCMLPKSLGHVFSTVCASPNSLWQLIPLTLKWSHSTSRFPFGRAQFYFDAFEGFSLLANEASGFIFLILLMVKHMWQYIR